jgi:hypothetical protein
MNNDYEAVTGKMISMNKERTLVIGIVRQYC